jgi:hypothetical protein
MRSQFFTYNLRGCVNSPYFCCRFNDDLGHHYRFKFPRQD